MLHQEAKDVSSVRIDSLIKMKKEAQPMEDVDFD
jgi:hypothetical protein